MKQFQCDRCRKNYQPLEWYSKYILSERVKVSEEKSVFSYIDLCPECYAKLVEWLNNAE